MEEWKKLKNEYYKTDIHVNYGGGVIDFSPKSMEKIKNGAFKSYSEYLDIQRKSASTSRTYFEMCYYDSINCSFKGRVEKVNLKRNTVLFSRIMVDGIYRDGFGFFGKEDHVWVKTNDISRIASNRCFQFNADIYRYMKHGQNGKLIDYGLQELSHIKEIEDYEVPTDDELIDQQIRQLVYEASIYHDHLIINNEDILNQNDVDQRIKTLKRLEPGKFTPLTVLLAYELEYRMLMQTGGIRFTKKDKNNHNYKVMKRFAKICKSVPVYYTGDVNEAFYRLAHPDKPRLYIE